MISGPSPLSQDNVKQSNEKNNNTKLGPRILHMLPSLLLNILAPLLIDMLAKNICLQLMHCYWPASYQLCLR